MATDAFLQFAQGGAAGGPVDGETQDEYYRTLKPPAFEISTWKFGTKNKATIGSATYGAGAGKAEFDPFTIDKAVDVSTPFLFENCCSGAHYKEVTLYVRKSGAEKGKAGKPFLQWKFALVFVEKMEWSKGDDAPKETVTFRYGAIQFTYNKQNPDGSLVQASEYEWSQLHNANEYAVD
jgi:type VI secretion system secreted protein Hcp